MSLSSARAAAALGPNAPYYNLDFTTAGTLADKIGAAYNDEWQSAIVQPSGAALEWRADGTATTLGNGIIIADGEAWIFENQQALLKVASFLGGAARVHFFS